MTHSRKLSFYSSKKSFSVFCDYKFKDDDLEDKYVIFQKENWEKFYYIGFYTILAHFLIKLSSTTTKYYKSSSQYGHYFEIANTHSIILALYLMSYFVFYRQIHKTLSNNWIKVLQFLIYQLQFFTEAIILYVFHSNQQIEGELDFISIKHKLYGSISNTLIASFIALITFFHRLNLIYALIYYFVFISFNVTLIIKMELDMIDYFSDMAILIIFPIVFLFFRLQLLKVMRSSFYSIESSRISKKYYLGYLENMDYSILSYKNLKPFYFNSTFNSNFIKTFDENTHSNLNYQHFISQFKLSEPRAPEISLKDTICKIMNKKSNKRILTHFVGTKLVKSIKNINKKFKYVGLYIYSPKEIDGKPETSGVRFFEIYFRKYDFCINHSTVDLVFSDVTSIKNSEFSNAENNLKTTMFGKIAHELKTPLITITSELEYLDEIVREISKLAPAKFSDAKLQDFHQAIEISKDIKYLSHYTIYLINDIISYSNISSKELCLKTSPIQNFEETMKFCFSVLTSLLKYSTGNKSNIQGQLNYDSNINTFTVITDEIRLKQVLLNIISNSVKFTNNGHIKINCYVTIGLPNKKSNEALMDMKKYHSLYHLANTKQIDIQEIESSRSITFFPLDDFLSSTRNLQELKKGTSTYEVNMKQTTKCCMEVELNSQKYVCVEISDTGMGIQAEIVKQINSNVAPENSLKNSDYNGSKGTGLGIGISKRICRDLGINIYCESESNEGTVFLIYLPIQLPNNLDCSSSDNSEKSDFSENDDSLIARNIASCDKTLPLMSNFVNNFDELIRTTNYCNSDPAIYRSPGSALSDNKPEKSKFSSPINLELGHDKREKIEANHHNARPIILIVDDSKVILNSLNRLLLQSSNIKEKFEVKLAFDGLEMINIIVESHVKNRVVELVLTDENMEYINGSQAVKLIKSISKKLNLSYKLNFISITAFEDEITKTNILNCGFSELLAKPVTKQKLKEVLGRLNIIY